MRMSFNQPITIEVVVEKDVLLEQLDAEDVVFHFGPGDLLTEIDMKDAIEVYGWKDLLEQIGRDKACEYFGLVPA